MKRYRIEVITGKVRVFIGNHLPDRERPNWHYYQTDSGEMLHFRKEHMVCVEEKEISNETRNQRN